jgi:hypothetical protein
MNPAEHYPDPFGEALSHSSSRAAQMISLAAAAAEVAARRMALKNARQAARDEQARRALHGAERAARERTRVRWAPAHDPRWLAQADLSQVAGTWSAAAAYADSDPAAAAALRKSEKRLRGLHPYAMARYDRLRAEGASPLNAMREAAPMFVREPDARPGDPSTRRLGIGPSPVGADTASAGAHAPADRNAATLAAESFPGTAADGIRTAVAGSLHQPARSPVPAVAARNVTRPGPPS